MFYKLIIFMFCLTYSFAQSIADSPDKKKLTSEAISIVKQFAGTLKPQLKAAMQTGGPVKAIDVCSIQAPEIAKKLSLDTGWTVKRVSMKARNSETATPDDWETKILFALEQRLSHGEAANSLAHAEKVDGKFRFMKAQIIVPLCLTCHGKKLTPDVQQALKLRYPKDMATGYDIGQIRGAFSLTKELK